MIWGFFWVFFKWLHFFVCVLFDHFNKIHVKSESLWQLVLDPLAFQTAQTWVSGYVKVEQDLMSWAVEPSLCRWSNSIPVCAFTLGSLSPKAARFFGSAVRNIFLLRWPAAIETSLLLFPISHAKIWESLNHFELHANAATIALKF